MFEYRPMGAGAVNNWRAGVVVGARGEFVGDVLEAERGFGDEGGRAGFRDQFVTGRAARG